MDASYRPADLVQLKDVLPSSLVTVKGSDCEGDRTAAQARAEGEAQLLRQLDDMLTEGGTVTSTRFSTAQQGDMLLVTLAAECYEEIGVSVAVEVE